MAPSHPNSSSSELPEFPAKIQIKPARGSSLLKKWHPSILKWNVHAPINSGLIYTKNEREELAFEWQPYSKVMSICYWWCWWSKIFMKLHPWGPGPLRIEAAGGLGGECGLTFIVQPIHRVKPSGTGLCPLEARFSCNSHRCKRELATILVNSAIAPPIYSWRNWTLGRCH